MKKGKITENVLKRSVLKYIHKRNDEVRKGADVGTDCAFLKWQPDGLGVCTQTVTLPIKRVGRYAVYAAADSLAAGGMKGTAITVSVTLPEWEEEKRLQELMKQIEEACKELDLEIVGGKSGRGE